MPSKFKIITLFALVASTMLIAGCSVEKTFGGNEISVKDLEKQGASGLESYIKDKGTNLDGQIKMNCPGKTFTPKKGKKLRCVASVPDGSKLGVTYTFSDDKGSFLLKADDHLMAGATDSSATDNSTTDSSATDSSSSDSTDSSAGDSSTDGTDGTDAAPSTGVDGGAPGCAAYDQEGNEIPRDELVCDADGNVLNYEDVK